MKKLLLLAGLTLAAASVARAQYRYGNYAPPKPKTRAVQADPSAKPEYAGLYINGVQMTDIDCYGFDNYDVVMPNFPNFATADKLVFSVGVYQYDANNKPLMPHADHIDYFTFEGPRLQALLEKFRGKGYIIVSKSDLVANFNKSRTLIPGPDNQLIDMGESSLNCAKYSKTDPAKTAQSVLVVGASTAQISGYGIASDGSSYPKYTFTPVFRAPAVALHNRVYTKDVPLKGLVVKSLPEMQVENCTTNKGNPLPLSTIKQVGEGGYGEELIID